MGWQRLGGRAGGSLRLTPEEFVNQRREKSQFGLLDFAAQVQRLIPEQARPLGGAVIGGRAIPGKGQAAIDENLLFAPFEDQAVHIDDPFADCHQRHC